MVWGLTAHTQVRLQMPAKERPLNSFHIAVAAEAFAAGLFAHAGYDVSVQYGANQPEYDLLVTAAGKFLKISVKGSQDGGWGLVQRHKRGRTYEQAIQHWLSLHSRGLLYCLVQFKGVKLGQCPRTYLATPKEVASEMLASRGGYCNTTIRETWTYTRGVAKGVTDVIPSKWAFSQHRLLQLSRSAT